MCKALEELIADGIETGRQEGAIIGFITACRKIGKTDEEIVRMVTEEFNVNEEEIYKIVSLN